MYTLIVSRLACDVSYTYMVVWSSVMRHGLVGVAWDMGVCMGYVNLCV